MKTHFGSVAIAILLPQACPADATTLPVVEQGIYHPAPPLVDLKQSIYVRERERPLLQHITNASDAIIQFLMDLYNAKGNTTAGIRHVMNESGSVPRLPPFATSPVQSRFVFMRLYCWESDSEDQLKFLVEWADATTKTRYTDSYVFVRRESSWYFEKHGSVAPWYWTQTERYFQRECPA